jgi:hypothetical protein
MKNISAVLAFAAFSLCAVAGSISVSAATSAAGSVEPVTSAVVMPVTQELPFDRYWSKS